MAAASLQRHFASKDHLPAKAFQANVRGPDSSRREEAHAGSVELAWLREDYREVFRIR